MKPLIGRILLVLTLSCALAFVAQAQSKPGISGTWKMNAEKSKFERGGPKAIMMKLDQQESTLRESLTITNDQGDKTVNLTYTLDGKESSQQIEDRQMKATAKWEGESLVIELKSDEGFTFRRKLTVSGDGKMITMTVQQSNSGGTATDTVILEKQ